MSDGRFGCGRVLDVDRSPGYGARTRFLGGLLDWVGAEPPTSASIAGAPLLEIGHAAVDVIVSEGQPILGEHPLGVEFTVLEHVMSYWGPGFPKSRLERRFVTGDPVAKAERRFVQPPLTDEMLAPSATGRGIIQFQEPFGDDEYRRLARWLENYPEMTLRVFSSPTIRDLEFLRFFPSLQSFAADTLFYFESADGLRHLPSTLRGLGLGAMRRPIDLSILERFPELTWLFLEKHQKGIEALSRLTRLEDLTLRSIKLPDLSLLVPLESLRSLDLKLGGTNDLGLLPEVGQLRYLELWRIRGLSDLSTVGGLPRLRHLFLQALPQVTTLPDFSEASSLRRIHLETMKGIRDLRPIATAPALEELVLGDLPQLQPDDLRPLVGHPTLRAVTAHLGGARKNAEAKALLGLPEVTFDWDWQDDEK
ncbi:MAG TPA: hypothetical protein VLJ76_11075 [Gaiellaceae bacterium]|nr:hypothetical protein [Gaiellaceae bacterium]